MRTSWFYWRQIAKEPGPPKAVMPGIEHRGCLVKVADKMTITSGFLWCQCSVDAAHKSGSSDPESIEQASHISSQIGERLRRDKSRQEFDIPKHTMMIPFPASCRNSS